MKIKKILNKELKTVAAQCCCQIVGKEEVYEENSCCKADCTHWNKGNDAEYTIYH